MYYKGLFCPSSKMLKWSVNRRLDHENFLDSHVTLSNNNRRSLGVVTHRPRTPAVKRNERRSLGSINRRFHINDKENHVTSTPYPSGTFKTPNGTPTAFKDLSNITPSTTPMGSSAQKRKRRLCLTPPQSLGPIDTIDPVPAPKPIQYASTLPTFGLEYSPYAFNPTPFIALRGLTTADSYLENPLYLRDEPPRKRLRGSPTQLSAKDDNANFKVPKPEEETLNSSAMSDTTLGKMIDAILESARKERSVPSRAKRKRSLKFTRDKVSSNKINSEQTFSPTYAAAEDPANDLNKFCDNFLHPRLPMFSEREVKTPEFEGFHLKRQNAVRRKLPKLDFTDGSELKSSQLNVFNVLSPETPLCSMLEFKSIDELANMKTPMEYRTRNECTLKPDGKVDIDDITPGIETRNVQGSSTPTSSLNSVRKCLTYSPESIKSSAEKRASVASSTSSRSSFKDACPKGSIDLMASIEDNKLIIHGEFLV